MRTAGKDHLAGISSATRQLRAELEGAALKVVARVSESERSQDLAIALSDTRLAVLRYVDLANTEDHIALATMISEGDFVWAGLVYSVQSGTDWPDDVETFQLSEVSGLIERLHELKRSAAP